MTLIVYHQWSPITYEVILSEAPYNVVNSIPIYIVFEQKNISITYISWTITFCEIYWIICEYCTANESCVQFAIHTCITNKIFLKYITLHFLTKDGATHSLIHHLSVYKKPTLFKKCLTDIGRMKPSICK